MAYTNFGEVEKKWKDYWESNNIIYWICSPTLRARGCT